MIQCHHLGVSDINICRIYDDSTLRFIIIFKYVFIKYIKRIISSTSSVLCTPRCIVHTFTSVHTWIQTTTHYGISSIKLSPFLKIFKFCRVSPLNIYQMVQKDILKKNKKHLTKTVSAAANLLFLRSLTELAMMLTSINVPNATQNLLQKCQVNPFKLLSTTANFWGN